MMFRVPHMVFMFLKNLFFLFLFSAPEGYVLFCDIILPHNYLRFGCSVHIAQQEAHNGSGALT